MAHTVILTTWDNNTYKKYQTKAKSYAYNVAYYTTARRTIYFATYKPTGNPWPKLLCDAAAEHIDDGDRIVCEGVSPLAQVEVLMRADVILWHRSLCRTWADFPVPAGYLGLFKANRRLAEFMSASVSARKDLTFWEKSFGVTSSVRSPQPLAGSFTATLKHSFTMECIQDPRQITVYPKCVLFDTGGWNLKTDGSISNMAYDCSAAAYVMACMFAGLQLNVSFTALVNEPGDYPGTDYAPPDSIPYRVTDTDAEGRVVLADEMVRVGLRGITVGTLSCTSMYIGTENALFVHALDTWPLEEGISDYTVSLPVLDATTLGLCDTDGVIRNFVGARADTQAAVSFIQARTGDLHLEHIDISNSAFPAHDDFAERYHYNVNGFIGLWCLLARFI